MMRVVNSAPHQEERCTVRCGKAAVDPRGPLRRRVAWIAGLLALVHAVALAGAGWYLLTPPVSHHEGQPISGWEVKLNAPLRSWVRRRAFDSAEACEGAKAKDLEWKREMKLTDELSLMMLEVDRNALCVASDDPRLR